MSEAFVISIPGHVVCQCCCINPVPPPDDDLTATVNFNEPQLVISHRPTTKYTIPYTNKIQPKRKLENRSNIPTRSDGLKMLNELRISMCGSVERFILMATIAWHLSPTDWKKVTVEDLNARKSIHGDTPDELIVAMAVQCVSKMGTDKSSQQLNEFISTTICTTIKNAFRRINRCNRHFDPRLSIQVLYQMGNNSRTYGMESAFHLASKLLY